MAEVGINVMYLHIRWYVINQDGRLRLCRSFALNIMEISVTYSGEREISSYYKDMHADPEKVI